MPSMVRGCGVRKDWPISVDPRRKAEFSTQQETASLVALPTAPIAQAKAAPTETFFATRLATGFGCATAHPASQPQASSAHSASMKPQQNTTASFPIAQTEALPTEIFCAPEKSPPFTCTFAGV